MGLEVGIKALKLEDRIDFFQTMATWLASAGGTVSVNDAVRNTCDAFSQDEYKSLMGRMKRIIEEYDSGQVTFHEALRSASLGFTNQELAVVAAAERSNQLKLALPALVDAMKMRNDSIRDLKKQLTMPVVGGFALYFNDTCGHAFYVADGAWPCITALARSFGKIPSYYSKVLVTIAVVNGE